MPNDFLWSGTPLTLEDENLVAAYEKVGKSLDLLPYTEDFERLLKEPDQNLVSKRKAEVFHRLLNLRKRALLSRANAVIDGTGEGMPLAVEEQELISAYQRIGRPLDALPYTEDFEQLIDELGKPKTAAMRHAVFQQLLRLRKRGRLPSNARSIKQARSTGEGA